ncbi:MAG: hypothetical protein ABI720_09985 [Actinomycetes bacterium]
MTTTKALQYWWCLTDERVETDDGCANTERLGPFDEYAQAAAALETARLRSEAWDKDPEWNDDGSDA